MRYKARIEDELFLGKQGENGAVTIVFPINAFYKEFGTYGVFEMLHQRAEDDDPYPCTFTQTIEGLEWTISNADNAYDGLGWLEIRYIVKDIVIKSITWRTRTLPALEEPTDIPPAPYRSWVDEVTKAGAAAVSARDAIENMSVAAQQTDYVSVNKSIDAAGNVKLNFGIPRGTPGYTPIKGIDYNDGEDGHTPTADEIKQVFKPELDAIDTKLDELAENKGVLSVYVEYDTDSYDQNDHDYHVVSVDTGIDEIIAALPNVQFECHFMKAGREEREVIRIDDYAIRGDCTNPGDAIYFSGGTNRLRIYYSKTYDFETGICLEHCTEIDEILVTQAEFINGKFSFMNSKGEEMYSATLPVYRGEAT